MISFTRVGKLVSQTSEPLAARSSALVSMYAILKTKVFQKHKKEDCRNAVLKKSEPMTSSKPEVQRFSRSKNVSSFFAAKPEKSGGDFRRKMSSVAVGQSNDASVAEIVYRNPSVYVLETVFFRPQK